MYSPASETVFALGLYSSNQGARCPALLVMPARSSACSSLIQRDGNAGRVVRTELGAPGVKAAGGKWPAQLPTLQLSWWGSTNCKELPKPAVPSGHGGV